MRKISWLTADMTITAIGKTNTELYELKASGHCQQEKNNTFHLNGF